MGKNSQSTEQTEQTANPTEPAIVAEPELTYVVEVSQPDTHYVNAPSKGKTDRSVNGVRVRTTLLLAGQTIGTLNSACYVSESGDLDISRPSAKVFSFSPLELARFKATVDEALTAWPLLDKAYDAAMDAFKAETVDRKASQKTARTASGAMTRLRARPTSTEPASK